MTKKRIIVIFSFVVVGLLCVFAAYALSRDTVRVTDAASGAPIRGAQVVPIYPSFGGPPYITNRRGVARIGGFGLPRGAAGYSVEVSASGYEKQSVPMFGAGTNHLDVALKAIH